ncbi:glycosyltransferase, partial [Candidatus Woesearchaeota archaeon]|nr:glycosyltransferase [Candidatus Woesearchaeota archaeon]
WKKGSQISACLDAVASLPLENSPLEITPAQQENLVRILDALRIKRLQGTLEALEEDLCGWAYDPADPDYKAAVYFFAEGIPLGMVEANEYRGDLKEAGLANGQCAFTWRNMSFKGLSILRAGHVIRAYFDVQRQRELAGKPIKLTPEAIDGLWLAVLDPERTDIDLQTKISLLKELLRYISGSSRKSSQDFNLAYSYILRYCTWLYLFGNYSTLISLLSEETISFRRQYALPIFELLLYRVFSLWSLQRLDAETMDIFEDALYKVIQEVEDSGNTLYDIQEASEEFQKIALKAEQSVELELSETATTKTVISQAEKVRKWYEKNIKSSCLENFNQVMALFYTEQQQNRDFSGVTNRYVRIMAKCLAQVYGDYGLAVNFIGIFSRDTDIKKDTEFYALSGRIHQILGMTYDALQYYLQAVRKGSASWQVYHEAAVLYSLICKNRPDLYRHKYREVTSLLTHGLHLNPQQSAGYKVAENFFQEWQETSIKYTGQLAVMGNPEDAIQQRNHDLEAMADALESVYEMHGENLFTAPAVRRLRRHGALVFVGSKSLWQCFYCRIKQKLDHARMVGYDTHYIDYSELSKKTWKDELIYGDALYICRLPMTFEVMDMMAYAQSMRIPIIYDIDDLIFDEHYFPSPLESYAGAITRELHLHLSLDTPLHRVALKRADFITCSTEPLARQIRAIDGLRGTVMVYPNLLSRELEIQALNHANTPLGKVRQSGIEIFYGSATKAHKQAFYEILCPALAVILTSHPETTLTLIGYFTLPEQLSGLADRIKLLEPSPNYMGYINKLRLADINLAILEQDTFTDCKSELKWFEAAVFGIPSVVTPTATYRTVLTEENNVLFAEDTGAWITQLKRLVESAELRQQLGERARAYALEHYRTEIGVECLQHVLGHRTKALATTRLRRKILFVNVYFAPQSVGGATRILESHVRYLLERYPDDFEIHVLTTEYDPAHWRPYSVEQYVYGQATVTKLRIPARDWADYEDEKIHAFCLEYYRRNAFDLIHFHSIQVLTASVVDAAREMKIPYLITLHDGWWLSRYLFLMDEKGNAIDPADPFSGSNTEHDDLLWLLERRNRLYRCLEEAHTVLAVSEKFRQLHEEAALSAHLKTNENGIEPFTILPRQPTVSGKVRIAHIGGTSRHKGFNLLREVISRGHFTRFEVMVIDLALEPGETYRDHWGTTPVQFRAKVKQSEVNGLYSQMDVLIAPSLWPESYGLVVREALYAGIWVIASNRGAVGDAITPGVNGRVVDVSDASGLMDALQEIEAAPEQFTFQRESVIPRAAAEQAEECVQHYRGILQATHIPSAA